MSRDEQERSIDEQRQALYDYARSQGYVIVGEYVDEGISGDATEKRLAFQRMIADCTRKRFEIILAWDQDRFGRFDPLEAGYWVKPMRDAGVVLETIAQGRIDWNDFAGRLIWSVTQEAKHSFLKDLARNSLRGNIARAKQGKSAGRVPFGFARGADGRYMLGDESEVETVRRIFALRLLRFGYRQIATKVNAENRPAPSSRQWSYDAVRIVLNREMYTGTLVYGRVHRGKYQTTTNGTPATQTGGQRINRSPIRVSNAHPPIIDLATWETVQAMKVDPPKPHAGRGNSGAPLAGLLVCGRCNAPMYAQSLQRASGQRNPNYICSSYHQGRKCGYCVVNQDTIHTLVAEAIKAKLGPNIKHLADALRTRIGARPKRSGAADLQKRLAKMDKDISAATARILTVNERLVADLEKRVLTMKDERDRLARQIDAMRETPARSAEEIANWLWSLGAVFQNSDAALVRSTLKSVFTKIVLTFEVGVKTGRGQGFRLTGGSIFTTATEPWCSLETSTLFGTSRIPIAA